MSPLAVKLYHTIQLIPKGKIATYGALAKYLKTSPRAAASMLAANPFPDTYPCYKIVHTDGRLGGYSGRDGVPGKIRRLQADGIEIVDGKVDLGKYGFEF